MKEIKKKDFQSLLFMKNNQPKLILVPKNTIWDDRFCPTVLSKRKTTVSAKGVQGRERPLLLNSSYQDTQLKMMACALKLERLEDLLGKIWEKTYQVVGRGTTCQNHSG